jgi:hypothetical protein
MAALGLVVSISGVASASVSPNHFAVIRFWPDSNEVTLQIPQPACPAARPSCVWTLYVNEPYVPAQTEVGKVSGTSGILTVAYPPDFCGVIQADALLGPSPLKLQIGHQTAVTTAPECPPVTRDTVPPLKPLPASDPPPVTGVGTGTGTTGSGTGTATLTNDPAHAAAAEAAQLPFTGIDVKPMGYIGVAMVITGLLLASTFEKRRRALRRVKMRTESATYHAARVSRWFLGE